MNIQIKDMSCLPVQKVLAILDYTKDWDIKYLKKKQYPKSYNLCICKNVKKIRRLVENGYEGLCKGGSINENMA